MEANSVEVADHVPRCRNPMKGGGPVIVVATFEFPAKKEGGGLEKSILSMYAGVWFRVLRTGRKVEFPPSFECARFGALFTSGFPLSKTFDDAFGSESDDEELEDDESVVEEDFGGRPSLGLSAIVASSLRYAGLVSAQARNSVRFDPSL